MTRKALLLSAALGLCLAVQARAQDVPDSPQTRAELPPADLQDRPVEVPPPSTMATSDNPDEIQFNADSIDYDFDNEIVTASGDVRLFRRSDRLRADNVVWNRKTGQVVATGNIVIVNPEGDAAYGDKIELTDSLKDGVVENMLVVLDAGGRIAARHGERKDNGVIEVDNAAYTPCSVTDLSNCPKDPSWKITADHVVYNPERRRIRYTGARISIFGMVSIPLPVFSHPIGGQSDDGFLQPDIRYNRTNGLQLALPYYFSLAPNRDLTITPRIYTGVLPMLQAEYRQLTGKGAFRTTVYGTYSRRSDDLLTAAPTATKNDFRGYIDAVGRYQLSPNWTASSSVRLTTDRTFLRRYDISRDDRLRNNIRVERIDPNSYFSVNAWVIQTLRVGERQGLQPYALPEIDYRRRMDDGLIGGRFEFQANSLAIGRSDGQDSQRAFASARWDLRKLTAWGQELILTAYGRGDVYNSDNTALTTQVSYRGREGFQFRGIGALAFDMKWPFVGDFLGGTQRITPRMQVVAAPPIRNIEVPNEDARAVDLEDSNLFALNRFPGYDRFEDSTRFTWGLDYALNLPGLTIDANVGQSYRLSSNATIFPDGTGLTDRVSDIVGRTVVRFRDFVSFTHRYRIDKDGFAVRRNEVDAAVGSRETYVQLGYLRLNRNIGPALEDLQDREEARIGARVKISRFWSVSGSILVDLTDRQEDLTSLADGFEPVRHRLGVTYEDDCLRLGFTWRRDYETTGDARKGNSYLLSLAFKNLGR